MYYFNRRRFLLSAASLTCLRTLARGQDTSTFSTDVKVVNVLASVRTKQGEFVRNLSKEDFSIAENGRPQRIQYFSRESDLPLTLGLLVDTSMSQERVLDSERGASFRFLDQVLREKKDKVFILQFDTATILRQPLTSSRKDLEEALSLVDTPTRYELSIQRGGGTLLYDAVVMAAKDVLKEQQNRKALILLTDGVDFGSEATVATAVEAAQRADTLVFSILFADAHFYSMLGPDGRRPLMRLAKETGGAFFEVSKKQSIEQIFAAIQEELRSQYNLGYVSDEPVRISEFRKIQLTAREKGLIVQARDKYWAKR
jgi:VWFA-related protein